MYSTTVFLLYLLFIVNAEYYNQPVTNPSVSPQLPLGYVPPNKPKPARGAAGPMTNLPPSTTVNKTFDGFSGMSNEQLQFLADDWERSKLRAAKALNQTSAKEGMIIIGKTIGNYFDYWNPEAGQMLGFGDLGANLDTMWNFQPAGLVLQVIITDFDQQMRALFGLDSEKYVTFVDNTAEFHWSRNALRFAQIRVMLSGFLRYIGPNVAGIKFYYGSEWTEKQENGYFTLFRLMNWYNWHIFQKYSDGCNARANGTFVASIACENCI